MSDSFVHLVDLASERLGAAVIAASDEFFAPKDNLIRVDPPRYRAGDYTERGKWMDGWETRRRRQPGADWCIVRLGAPGIVRGVDVETTFFTGNSPESCAVAVCDATSPAPPGALDGAAWTDILPNTPLASDAHNLFETKGAPPATHLRLRIVPDGGVARLRVYGEVAPDWTRLRRRGDVDLAAVEHGGVVVACSDMFYGSRHNLIMPGDARDMGDGWETKRRRGPGHDWTIVRLGAPGVIRRIEVDTTHFKGNAPAACSVEGCSAAFGADLLVGAAEWREIVEATPLQPDARHRFEDNVRGVGAVACVRLNIFPDGGVARLRVFGRLE